MEKRIYYHDTDAGGVVYYGNYLKYLEESRTEFLEKKGLSVTQMHRAGFFYAVRKCSLAYKSPARYGDTVVCEARLKEITPARLIFAQTIRDKSSGRLLVEAQVELVGLTKDFKPQAIPEAVKVKLQ
ncbi:MAG: YbgC/FadM family acyl-CoA thioesterase [Candidatus Omnitrophica bacterium]|nr:YbgC/FadM family acyl-CoA thioesterase [Candidatus Omnitrophota bacterium]